MVLLEPTAAGAPFSQRVQRCFGRSAAAYPSQARLQAAVAERLARWLTRLTPAPPAGIRADLGAGSGLLARAIERRLGGPPLLRLDSCPELLQLETAAAPPQRLWDLNHGLPPELQGAALLGSSFALQWLEQPQRQLEQWCAALAPGACWPWRCPAPAASGSGTRPAGGPGCPSQGWSCRRPSR